MEQAEEEEEDRRFLVVKVVEVVEVKFRQLEPKVTKKQTFKSRLVFHSG